MSSLTRDNLGSLACPIRRDKDVFVTSTNESSSNTPSAFGLRLVALHPPRFACQVSTFVHNQEKCFEMGTYRANMKTYKSSNLFYSSSLLLLCQTCLTIVPLPSPLNAGEIGGQQLLKQHATADAQQCVCKGSR